MPKDLSLMQVTALVPTAKVHQACAWLEDNGATQMMVRAHRDNPLTPEERKHITSVIRSATGQVNGQDNKALGESQQLWIASHTKGEFKAKDIQREWLHAGFTPGSIYSALARAVKDKLIKKVRPGVYRNLGKVTHG